MLDLFIWIQLTLYYTRNIAVSATKPLLQSFPSIMWKGEIDSNDYCGRKKKKAKENINLQAILIKITASFQWILQYLPHQILSTTEWSDKVWRAGSLNWKSLVLVLPHLLISSGNLVKYFTILSLALCVCVCSVAFSHVQLFATLWL